MSIYDKQLNISKDLIGGQYEMLEMHAHIVFFWESMGGSSKDSNMFMVKVLKCN